MSRKQVTSVFDALTGQIKAAMGKKGPGVFALQGLLKIMVIHIYMTEIIDERIRLAQNNGADWVGNLQKENIVTAIGRAELGGIDIVYECAGKQETLDQGIELLKPGGKLMMVGIPREDRVSFSSDLLRRKEITLINVRRQNHCTHEAIDLLATGKVNLDFMVTHRFDFAQTQSAFDLIAGYRNGSVKVIIQLQ